MREERVFVHAWWRSGSTYVWGKLRENDRLVCYYEPLHERISRLSLDDIEHPQAIEKSRSLRHPMQTKSYYAEYATLLRSNGLGFSPTLSYERFLLRPEQTDEQLHKYIQGLIDAACGRTAVLCFCRSQMRSAWMRKTFGGVHIAQIRNLAAQWASFNTENPYFIERMLTIALRLRDLHPPAFAHIESFERFAQAVSSRPSLPVDQLYGSFIRQNDILAIFMVIWIASALQAISHSDFVLDIDLLSTDLQYRNVASQWFATIGHHIDFSDCASPSTGQLPLPAIEFDRMVDHAEKAIRSNASALVIASPRAVDKLLPSLSRLSGKILRSVLTDGL
jgi:hypothetical protein